MFRINFLVGPESGFAFPLFGIIQLVIFILLSCVISCCYCFAGKKGNLEVVNSEEENKEKFN